MIRDSFRDSSFANHIFVIRGSGKRDSGFAFRDSANHIRGAPENVIRDSRSVIRSRITFS